jgi:hypothetical protein
MRFVILTIALASLVGPFVAVGASAATCAAGVFVVEERIELAEPPTAPVGVVIDCMRGMTGILRFVEETPSGYMFAYTGFLSDHE